jgi:uncharacterized membrane protein
MSATTENAWGEAARSEPRWPASLAVVVAGICYLILPGKFTLGPSWVIPLIEAFVLIPLSIAAPERRPHEKWLVQYAAFAIIAIAEIANITSLTQLIHALVYNAKTVSGPELLVSSIAIWLTNVIVFSLWFYELDRGGPDDRLRREHGKPDFLFPQMSTPGCTHERWAPTYFDYLYLSFTNATAFSPTDTMPLTPAAKALMLIESLASLLTITIVASRAVNILA